MKHHAHEELSNVVFRPETSASYGRGRAARLAVLRPWAVAGMLLLLTECFFRLFLPAALLKDPRLNACRTYQEFLDAMGVKNQPRHLELFLRLAARKDPGAVNVYFLGDSVLLGNGPFKELRGDPRDDLALSFEHEMRRRFPGSRFVVHNVSSYGVGEYTAFEMLKVLGRFKPDVLIKNVNFRVFNEYPVKAVEKLPSEARQGSSPRAVAEENAPPRMALTRLALKRLARMRMALTRMALARLPIKEWSEQAGMALDALLNQHSMLYAGRDYCVFLLMRGAKNEQLERAAARLTLKQECPDILRDGVYHLTPRAIKEMTALVYNFSLIPANSRSYTASQKSAAYAADADMCSFFFMSPFNQGLVYSLVRDRQVFDANRERVNAIFEQRKVCYRDFSQALDDSDFRDAEHLTESGNNRLAALIADELEPLLSEIIERKERAQ